MGSFEPACGFSKLAVESGDRAGLVLLGNTESSKLYKERFEGGKTIRTYAYDDFFPFLPPIFGRYDGYGRLEEVEPCHTVTVLEKMFHRPIDTILSCLGQDRNVYDSYGEIYSNYLTPEFQDQISRDSTVDDTLLAAGFAKVEDSVYMYDKWHLVSNDSRWILSDPNSPGYERELKVYADPADDDDADELLAEFAEHTGMYPGIAQEEWQAVRRLHNLNGMFFLGDLFDKMLPVVEEDFFAIQGKPRFFEGWEALQQKFVKSHDADVKSWDKYPSAWNTEGNEFIKRYTCLNPNEYDYLEGFPVDEFYKIQVIHDLASNLGTLLTPTIIMPDGGNDDFVEALGEFTKKVLAVREEYMEGEIEVKNYA